MHLVEEEISLGSAEDVRKSITDLILASRIP
jgi:hypothetical protein